MPTATVTPQKAIRGKRAPAETKVVEEVKWTRITTEATEAERLPISLQLDTPPSLGSKPVPLKVKPSEGDQDHGQLAAGLRTLYQRGECCDVHLVCCGRTFPCHQVVLVARSRTFKEGLGGSGAGLPPGGCKEVRLVEVSNPEAVRFMLDYMYEADVSDLKAPHHQALSVMAVNRDVLGLAQKFELPGLTQRAAQWLAKDISTGNVVERLAMCTEFGLTELRTRIVEQLAMNRAALLEVASCPKIMEYPELMQEILKQTAASGGDVAVPPKRKPSTADAAPAAKRAKAGR